METITLNQNLPPPPTIQEVLELLPTDFLADHPPTDRLASVIDSWNLSKQLVSESQRVTDLVFADLVAATQLLQECKDSSGEQKPKIEEFLSKFNLPA
jgi:hypothetical protein